MAARSHDSRTLSLWINLTQEHSTTPPIVHELYKLEHTVDLNRPEPWPIDHEVTYSGVNYSFRSIVKVEREDKVFFPGLARTYILFDTWALGTIDPPPIGVPVRPSGSKCWLDENTIYAGSWLRIGPLKQDQRLFLDFNIQFSP